jgi:EAL domain-containing protein (putative c-di-GMP-specific phosphodiesterase class I)
LERLAELDRRAIDQARRRITGRISAGEPSIAYQPIFDLVSGSVVAVEALARFEGEPVQGPDVWFAEAWEAGLGLELELAAIRNAIAGFRQMPEQVMLAVNASAQTVQAPGLIELVRELASRIVIEVTEHADLGDADSFIGAIAGLRELGVRLAIDDVGTGFSGLSRLLEMSPDLIKLDLSLTRDIDHDDQRASLTTSLVAFGRDAEIEVVAEGIETQAELDALMARGVRFGQGYYLGRPTRTIGDILDGRTFDGRAK